MLRALLVLLVMASSASAATWHVQADGLGDVPTIQAAVDSAAPGDTLLLADGTYRGDGNRDVSVNKMLRIWSESNDPEACIIDCEGSSATPHRAFSIAGGSDDPDISGLSVVNSWQAWGGAIWAEPPGVDVRNCIFSGNTHGCVFIADRGSPSVISECVFRDNHAYSASAVFVYYHHSTIIIEHSLFVDNNSEWTTVTVDDDYGDLQVRLNNCTFVGNSGYYSAIENVGSEDCELNNCIIAFGAGESSPCYDCYINCSAFYENQPDPGWLPPWGSGNFTGCPSFCDYLADPPDFNICSGSPCAPGNHPYGAECGLIGALGVGCVCGPSRAEAATLGSIKSRFRE